MVKLVKLGIGPQQDEVAWEVAVRHLATPFVFLPFPGETEYAVIVAPPFGAYLEHTVILPISEVLAHFDGSRLRLPDAVN